jgi:hypothetical protein
MYLHIVQSRCPVEFFPALIYQQAVRLFGEEGTAEFIYLVGLYCMVSVTLNGFDVPVPEVDESPKPPRN